MRHNRCRDMNDFTEIDDFLKLYDRKFLSRLIIGTGKYASKPLMADAIRLSGAEIVTTAVRRISLTNKQDPFITYVSPDDFLFLGTVPIDFDDIFSVR